MIYRHYKGGLYRVLFEALESTNGRERESLIVYVSLETGQINVRTAREFQERVTWPDGTRSARFTIAWDV